MPAKFSRYTVYIPNVQPTLIYINRYWLTFTVIFISIGLAVTCETGTGRIITQKRRVNFLQATCISKLKKLLYGLCY